MTEKPEKSAYEQLKAVQRRFVDLTVQGYTGADSIRKLRPKCKRPDVLASKWKALELVRRAIEERRAEAMEDAGIANAQILLDIAQLSNVSVKRLVWCADETLPGGVAVGQPKKLHELDDVTARCIQSFEYSMGGVLKARVIDRLAAKKLLGQYKRLFTETHEISLGEKTLEQLLEASWNRPRKTPENEGGAPPAAGL